MNSLIFQTICSNIFKEVNPRNEREFDDVIKDQLNITWKTYKIWAFGEDALECCICEDIPEHYIECHICEKNICNDCFENDTLRGDSFYMITTTDKKGQLGAYYCEACYNSNINSNINR